MLTSLTQHIYMNSLTHKVDLNVYITCTHYKFNSKVFDFYLDKDFNEYNCHNFHKKAHVLSTWTFAIYITGNLT